VREGEGKQGEKGEEVELRLIHARGSAWTGTTRASDRAGRYSEEDDDPKLLQTGPRPFSFYFVQVLSSFKFLFSI
jgi:hypothetical protein